MKRHHRDRLMALALMAPLVALFPASQAQAAVICQIPRSLLCEGCASELQISIRRGSCRVSFNASQSSPGSLIGTVSLRVVQETPAPAPRRLRRAPRTAEVPRGPGTGARCFHFAGRRYCE